MTENRFNRKPYFDDWEREDDFLKILFHPGRDIQTRELNQIQSILQNQIETIGKHLFKNGTPVLGGEISKFRPTYIKVDSTFLSNPVLVDEFLNQDIIFKDSLGNPTGTKAKVIAVEEATSTDPITLFVQFNDSLTTIANGEQIFVDGSTIGCEILTEPNSYGLSYHVGINEGYFFLNGFFIFVDKQSIVISKYSVDPTGYVGLLLTDDIIDYTKDSSLLDNSRGSENFAAPGADRLKGIAELKYVDSVDSIPETFVQLMHLEQGGEQSEIIHTVYSELAKELARRTYAESGDYTVKPFIGIAEDDDKNLIVSLLKSPEVGRDLAILKSSFPHNMIVGENMRVFGATGDDAAIYNIESIVDEVVDEFTFIYEMTSTPVGDAEGESRYYEKIDNFSVTLSSGNAYVRGYELKTISDTNLSIKRPRTVERVDNFRISVSYGNYAIVKELSGVFEPTLMREVDLKNVSDATIGTARLRHIRNHTSGTQRFYLYGFEFTGTESFSLVTSIEDPISTASANIDDLSIINGKSTLFGSERSNPVFPIPQTAVKTLEPDAIRTISVVFSKRFQSSATGTSVVFGVTGSQTFHGPVGIDLIDTDFLKFYYAVNNTTGNVLDISSAIISNSGETLTLVINESGADVVLIGSIQEIQINSKDKVKTSSTITIPASTFSSSVRAYTLGVPDCLDLTSVIDNDDSSDITDRFSIQAENDFFVFKDGDLILNGGSDLPIGSIDVTFNHYTHTGDTFFSVDSYVTSEFENVGFYGDASGKFRYTDIIDFRPEISGTNHQDSMIPVPGTTISADYEFYVPRRDRIVLDKYGKFRAIGGIPKLHPQLPPTPEDAMCLYELYIPPYLYDAGDCVLRFIENERFTMRDIGKIKRRVNRMEYYTPISLLEMQTFQTPITDETGLERFKNGMIVDDFKDHSVGNIDSADYRCAIDIDNFELLPAFVPDNVDMEYKNATGSVVINNNIITLPYTAIDFVKNDTASRFDSVNPFLVYTHIGVIECDPPSDHWVDTSRTPATNVEFVSEGVEDGLGEGFGTIVSSTSNASWNGTTTDITTTNFSTEIDVITESAGDRITDINFIPFMREITITFSVEGLRPNRDLHAFFDNIKMNHEITPDAGFEPVSEGSIRTDDNGIATGTLHIPSGSFYTGDRIFKLIDDPNNIDENSSNWASYAFNSAGIEAERNELIISTQISRTVISQSSITQFQARDAGNGDDPLAQSFVVSKDAYPNGLFLSDIDLFFKTKDSIAPVQLQIRPMVNGYPSSIDVVENSIVFVNPDDINIPVKTDDIESIRLSPTNFQFKNPIYLPPGEFAFVVLSTSSEHECYISVLGQRELGTNLTIGAQPTLGSLYKSQNSRTWTAVQNEDIMMVVRRSSFDVSGNPIVHLRNMWDSNTKQMNNIRLGLGVLEFSDVATLDMEAQTKSLTTLTLGSFNPIHNNVDEFFDEEMIIDGSETFLSNITMSSSSEKVSPVIDLSRNACFISRNLINNLGLLSEDFSIISTGSGYTTTDVTLTGGGGSGASLEAVLSDGRVVGITVIEPGENYDGSTPIVITITGDGTGADVEYTEFETSPIGGNAKARYVSREIELSEDWESDFLKVYIDANVPAGTKVQTYIKTKARHDEIQFNDQPWIKLIQDNDIEIISSSIDDYKEIAFVPENTLSYTRDDGVIFPYINHVAFKIVLLSNNTSIIPKLKNFRGVTVVV